MSTENNDQENKENSNSKNKPAKKGVLGKLKEALSGGSEKEKTVNYHNKEFDVIMDNQLLTEQEKTERITELSEKSISDLIDNKDLNEDQVGLAIKELRVKVSEGENPNDIEVKGAENVGDNKSTNALKETLKKIEEDKDNSTEEDISDSRPATKQEIVTQIRLELDMAMQKTAVVFGKESDIYKSIFMGKSWLGHVMGSLGSKNPYKKEIPKTVDVFDNQKALNEFKNQNKLQQVLYLKSILGLCATSIDLFEFDIIEAGEKTSEQEYQKFVSGQKAKAFSYMHIIEARFGLGNELSIIRNK